MYGHSYHADGSLPKSFYAELGNLLYGCADGISEYELLQLIKEKGYFSFWTKHSASSLELYQAHFLLFHALYRLQDEYYRTQFGILEISPLNIRLKSYSSGTVGIQEIDPLRDYYLNLANLESMTENGVNELLDAFWRDFIRFDNRAMALAELGLSDPVDEATIKQAYRRLAMEHHPDRGGEEWRLQAINAAYACLRKSSL